jgi:hypothetical protein
MVSSASAASGSVTHQRPYGVGSGSSKADYDAVGVPFEQRWQRFDQTL